MKKLLILAALVPLAACIRFGSEPPPSLLTLDARSSMRAGAAISADANGTILIRPIDASREIAVARVPVRSSGTQVAYLKDAQWVEPPADMFTRLLADTISAETGRVAIGQREFQFGAGVQLSGDLRNFTIIDATREAVVTFDAALSRSGSDLETRRFEARIPLSEIAPIPAGEALNEAANQVAGEVADWIGN